VGAVDPTIQLGKLGLVGELGISEVAVPPECRDPLLGVLGFAKDSTASG